MRGKILKRGSQLWAVGLVLVFAGLAGVVGVWLLLIALGAPPLSVLVITFGAGMIVAGGVGEVMRWLAHG